MDDKLTIVDRVLFLMELDLFRSVDSAQVARIAARATELHVEAGQIIYEQGHPAEQLYLVVDGEVELSRDGTAYHRFRRGAGFGLAAILGPDEIYEQTASAVRPTHVLCLSRDGFYEAVGEYPDFAAAMIRSLATALMDLGRKMDRLEQQSGGVAAGAFSSHLGPTAPAGAPPTEKD